MDKDKNELIIERMLDDIFNLFYEDNQIKRELSFIKFDYYNGKLLNFEFDSIDDSYLSLNIIDAHKLRKELYYSVDKFLIEVCEGVNLKFRTFPSKNKIIFKND